MKPKTALGYAQLVDQCVTELCQQVLTLQEELKDAQNIIKTISRSKIPKEVAREYCAQLFKYPKT